MIKLAELYSPNALITHPPASFLKVTGDQQLRYIWPKVDQQLNGMMFVSWQLLKQLYSTDHLCSLLVLL